ncbi:MAG: sigma factor-like helix-turn-helix DNA-binding protein [Nocardioides sp.]
MIAGTPGWTSSTRWRRSRPPTRSTSSCPLREDVHGLSYDDIAELLGVPLGTVKAQIHHGRKLARPLLRGDA